MKANVARGDVWMTSEALAGDDLEALDQYWRAANYLTVGQIYLLANPLLREPLRAEHIKPRLLGHWGTSPGLSLLYVHLNRIIRERDLNVVYLTGPGHGGPAMLANVYLEGTYSEVYPTITQDARGMDRLFRQFSTPGGVPSHVGPHTPGSIHEGAGFMDTVISKQGTVARVYLPPDGNCLLSVADHCLRSRNYVNLVIIDKQPQLQWLDMTEARAHCARGASVWPWASAEAGDDALDVVLACAGDTPTLETLAAAAWLRENVPEMRVRVVNVVDLILNETSRFHIAMDAIRPSRRPVNNAAEHTAECMRRLAEHTAYVHEHFEDMPEIRDWIWTGA